MEEKLYRARAGKASVCVFRCMGKQTIKKGENRRRSEADLPRPGTTWLQRPSSLAPDIGMVPGPRASFGGRGIIDFPIGLSQCFPSDGP